METRLEPDRFNMLKAAATSMSSALLLVLVGGDTLIYVLAFFFGLVSVAYAIGSVIRIPRIPRQLAGLGLTLPYSFLIVSFISIFRSWGQVRKILDSLALSGRVPQWLASSLSFLPLLWLVIWTLALSILVIRDIRLEAKRHGRQRQVIRIVGAIGLFCGLLFTLFRPLHVPIESVAQYSIVAAIVFVGLTLVMWRSK